jgi:hypothetical protein
VKQATIELTIEGISQPDSETLHFYNEYFIKVPERMTVVSVELPSSTVSFSKRFCLNSAHMWTVSTFVQRILGSGASLELDGVKLTKEFAMFLSLCSRRSESACRQSNGERVACVP